MAFDAGSIFGKLKLDKSGFTQSVKAVNKDQKSMQTSASKSGVAFKGMWKQMAAGLGVTAGITMAVRGLIRQFSDVIERGREFEREWANVTTMLSVSQGETDKLKTELQKLPPVLGDTTELAKGMYQVLSASVEPAKAIDVLTASAKAAKAGLTETNTAVDAITTVLNAYGMEAEEATNISDIMFMTVKRGKLTFGELAHSLGTVAPVAGTIGIKFDEVAAAIASLTRQGIPAATATMQLRQVMMAVLKPSEQAKKKAEELGIEWSAAALKAKGLGGFLAEVKEKTGGNSEALSKLVPNVRALTGVMALAGRAADGFEKDLGLMSNAAGSTDEAFKKNIDTFDTWLATAKVVSNKGKEAFYEGLINPIKEAVGSAEDLELASIKLQKTMKTLGSVFGEIAVSIGSLSKGYDGLIERQTNIIMKAIGMETIQERNNRLMIEAKHEVEAFVQEMDNLNVSYEEAKKQREKGKESWEKWTSSMRTANSTIGLGKGLINALKEGYKEYTESLEDNKEEIDKTIISHKTFTIETKNLGDETKKTHENLSDLLSLNIRDWADEGAAAIDFVSQGITQLGQSSIDMGQLWDLNKPDVQAWANDNVIPGLQDVEKGTEEVITNTTSLWNQMTDGLKTKWATTFSDMLSGATSFKDGMDQLWEGMKEQFFDIVGQMIAKWVTDFLGNLFTESTSIFNDIFGTIGNAASGAAQAAAGASSSLSGVFLGLGAAVGTFLGTLLSGGDDLSYTNKLLETIAWDQSAKMDNTNAQLHEIKLTAWNVNDKLGALYNAMTTQGTVYVNMFASDPIERLGQDFNRGLTGLGGDIVTLGGKIGNGIAGLEKGIRDSNNKFIKSMKNFNEASGAQGASMMGARAISAQDEGTWYVQAQEQLFRAHRGEIVDIRHVDSQQTRAGFDSVGNINVQIKPVVIPKNDKYLINFTVEKVERLKKDIIKGNVPINLGAIAGGRL